MILDTQNFGLKEDVYNIQNYEEIVMSENPWKGDKFEYYCETNNFEYPIDEQKFLNQMGKYGYELILIRPEMQNSTRYYFKRKIKNIDTKL